MSDVLYFWIEGGGPLKDFSYHTCIDCAWLSVAQWHGGRLVSSESPPVHAGDEASVGGLVPDGFGPPAGAERTGATDQAKRRLCAVCERYRPRSVATPDEAADERCLQCGCGREMHISCRSSFDQGCGMAWADAIYDRHGQTLQVGLIHCPCDGYAPPLGAQGVVDPKTIVATNAFDSMLQFPTTRARLDPHGPTGDGSYDEPIVDLAVDHLAVDVSVIDLGLVTIAASSRNKLVDGYGFGFDLDASDANALGRQLIAEWRLQGGRERSLERTGFRRPRT